jgi:hypothetical protein
MAQQDPTDNQEKAFESGTIKKVPDGGPTILIPAAATCCHTLERLGDL